MTDEVMAPATAPAADERALQAAASTLLRMARYGAFAAWLPGPLGARAIAHANRRHGPQRDAFPGFARFLAHLGLPADTFPLLWRRCQTSHAQLFRNLALHRHRIGRIRREILSHDPDWERLLGERNGVLVLQAHNDFQHTLCAVLGDAGLRLRVLAVAETESPLYPLIGPQIERMHRDCACHFQGGNYLFVGAEGNPVRALNSALTDGECVISLHDTPAPAGMRHAGVPFLGRTVRLPSGAIELALRRQIPVYFAQMVWLEEKRGYHLFVRALNPEPDTPLAAYARALEALIRAYPWAWNGWQWFEQLG